MKKFSSFVVVALGVAVCHVAYGHGPEHDSGSPAKRDQVLAAVQQICPVSGNKLGEHGTPLKVKIGKEEVFLCCKGCTKRKIDPKHWATIHANFAKAQVQCPVMEEKLPKNPKWTVVKGRIVYVCCPPCTKKVEANPDKYVKMVDALYVASLKKKATAR